LGLISVEQLLRECGYRCVEADATVCAFLNAPEIPPNLDGIAHWIASHGISVLGLSYRLDPEAGARWVAAVMSGLKSRKIFEEQGGRVRAVFFAGLPKTCDLVRRHVPGIAGVFDGDETPRETLERLGIDPAALPGELAASTRYDEDRFAFGLELVRRGEYMAIPPPQRSDYPEFGTVRDTLIARLRHAKRQGSLPLIRAHAGPYLPDRSAAVRLFLDWTRRLAAGGHLDVLSIGTSQLTQSNFGEDWGNRPNGGGAPLNSPEEYAAVWHAARPMLVRTYAGTKNILELARMYEKRMHIAWHALSLWWFCRLDGRGPLSLRENLEQQIETLRYIGTTGKPYEPNVAHHFAFRGADDVSCIVATVIAARTAKAAGIRHLVLQIMLNTPRATWGVQDLAKARATLSLVRELEDNTFRVILQPRGGLDYFSPHPEKARAQLAAITALMDDIEPHDETSPPLIHVVSYSEGYKLADPPVIEESIKITRHALAEYRRLRRRGNVDDMTEHPEVVARTEELLSEARTVLGAIEKAIPEPYTPDGLYHTLVGGFLAVPYLWECRDELARAVQWQTRIIRGAVRVVDDHGIPLNAKERMARVRRALLTLPPS